MRLTTSRLRAIRAVGHPNRAARYASTAIQHPDESVPEPVVKVPVVRELEGLYDILEGQVGGDVVWSERAMSALQRIEADHQVRVGGASFHWLCLFFVSWELSRLRSVQRYAGRGSQRCRECCHGAPA